SPLDLFDIIELSRSYGMTTRVVTNGLKMADREYCDRLLETRATILLSYDGDNPETYRKLRGTDSALRPKQEAIENIGKSPHLRRGKVYLISCIAKGVNDQELPDLLEFYHSQRAFISTVHLMPLAHTWESYDTDFEPERITTECLEQLVEDVFPDEQVQFVPAGFIAQFSTVAKYVGRAAMPFLGAHPNCESIYLLVSDGEKYVPISRYLRGSLVDLGSTMMQVEKRLAAREQKSEAGPVGRVLSALRLKKPALTLRGVAAVLSVVL
ncbi:unnamed protein product, partial [marine sediment metagenome]